MRLSSHRTSAVFTLLVVCSVLAFPSDASCEEPREKTAPIRLVVYPYTGRNLVARDFTPIVRHLVESAEQPMELAVAPSYLRLVQDVRNRGFELAFVPTELAALITEDFEYSTLASAPRAVKYALYVRKKSSIDGLEALRGGTISLPDPLSLPAILGLEFLEGKGLLEGRDVEIQYHRTHSDALFSLLNQRADAVITTPQVLASLVPRFAGDFRSIAQLDEVPAAELLVRDGLSPTVARRLGDALSSYEAPADSPFIRKGDHPFRLGVAVDASTRARIAKRTRTALERVEQERPEAPASE